MSHPTSLAARRNELLKALDVQTTKLEKCMVALSHGKGSEDCTQDKVNDGRGENDPIFPHNMNWMEQQASQFSSSYGHKDHDDFVIPPACAPYSEPESDLENQGDGGKYSSLQIGGFLKNPFQDTNTTGQSSQWFLDNQTAADVQELHNHHDVEHETEACAQPHEQLPLQQGMLDSQIAKIVHLEEKLAGLAEEMDDLKQIAQEKEELRKQREEINALKLSIDSLQNILQLKNVTDGLNGTAHLSAGSSGTQTIMGTFAEQDESLIEASKDRNYISIRELVEQGADVNTQDLDGLSPLHWVALWGDLQCTLFLLKRGACPNICDSNARTPLMLSAQEGHPNTVEALLENGADAAMLDIWGASALDEAKMMNHTRVVDLLSK